MAAVFSPCLALPCRAPPGRAVPRLVMLIASHRPLLRMDWELLTALAMPGQATPGLATTRQSTPVIQ